MSQVTAETGIPVAGQETIAPSRGLQLLRPLQLAGPFVVALIVGAIVLAASGRDAAGTYWLLLQQSLGGPTEIANTLVAATPVLLTGLATAIAFRSGMFNVGVEGSLYVGAFAAAWAGFTLTRLPGPIVILVAVALAGLAGAVWALIPGILRAQWRVDEVVTTLMLNYVAILLTSWLVNYFFLAPDIANSMSPLIASDARLAPLLPRSQLTIAFLLALVVTLLYAYLFNRATIGYQLRMTGLNPRFARAVGINLGRSIIVAFLLSGLIGGFAGGLQILGVNYRFIDQHFYTGTTWSSLDTRNAPIHVAVLWGAANYRVVPSGPAQLIAGNRVVNLGAGQAVSLTLFFGALSNGGAMIQLFSDIPLDLINILQGVVMIFAVIELSRLPFVRRWLQRA